MTEQVMMQPEMVEGLKQFHPDELTPEELAAIDQADDIARAQEAERKENTVENLAQALQEFDNAPNIYDLEGWKDQYGVIHMSTVTGEDVYLWRVLKRSEYKQLFKTGALNERIRGEDTIVRKCLLWPQPNDVFMNSSGAGIVSTLKEQIMHQSGFIPEQQAIQMIKMI